MALSRKGLGLPVNQPAPPLETIVSEDPSPGPGAARLAGPVKASFAEGPVKAPLAEAQVKAPFAEGPVKEPSAGSPVKEPLAEGPGKSPLAGSGQRAIGGPAAAPPAAIVVLSLDATPENSRRPDPLSLKVLTLGPGDSGSGLWSLPTAPGGDSSERAVAELARGLTGHEEPWLEPLGTFPGERGEFLAWLALTDRGGSGSGRRVWLSVRPDWAGGRIDLAEDAPIGPTLLTPTVQTMGRVRVSGFRVSSAPLAPGHAEALVAGLMRLRETLQTSDRIFNLMPETFSLESLRRAFEIVSGSRLQVQNFRRKIAPKLTATMEFARKKSFRPPRLFRYDPDWRLGPGAYQSGLETGAGESAG